MKSVLLLTLGLILFGCDSLKGDRGATGAQGPQGATGPYDRFVSSIDCTGTLSGGIWSGVTVNYSQHTTLSGDVYAQVDVGNIGSFNNSATAFYSVQQNGHSSGTVLVQIDNYNYFEVGYSSSANNIVVIIHSSNGNGGTYANSNACTYQTY